MYTFGVTIALIASVIGVVSSVPCYQPGYQCSEDGRQVLLCSQDNGIPEVVFDCSNTETEDPQCSQGMCASSVPSADFVCQYKGIVPDPVDCRRAYICAEVTEPPIAELECGAGFYYEGRCVDECPRLEAVCPEVEHRGILDDQLCYVCAEDLTPLVVACATSRSPKEAPVTSSNITANLDVICPTVGYQCSKDCKDMFFCVAAGSKNPLSLGSCSADQYCVLNQTVGTSCETQENSFCANPTEKPFTCIVSEQVVPDVFNCSRAFRCADQLKPPVEQIACAQGFLSENLSTCVSTCSRSKFECPEEWYQGVLDSTFCYVCDSNKYPSIVLPCSYLQDDNTTTTTTETSTDDSTLSSSTETSTDESTTSSSTETSTDESTTSSSTETSTDESTTSSSTETSTDDSTMSSSSETTTISSSTETSTDDSTISSSTSTTEEPTTTETPPTPPTSCSYPGETFPDPVLCNWYYYCSNQIQVIHVQCPVGTWFHATLLQCVRASRCPQDPPPTENPNSTTPPPCTYEGQTFPDPNECHYYYYCNNMLKPIYVMCPVTTWFSKKLLICVIASECPSF